MSDDFWSKLDAYLFKALGLILGGGGCVALAVNNPLEKLTHNPYGVVIFFSFGAMGLYSLYSLALDLLGKPE